MKWTVQEAAKDLDISGARIRLLCKNKRIKAYKDGYDWVITSLKIEEVKKKRSKRK